MSPRLRALLARVTLAAGVALVAAYLARNSPHPQTLVIRLGEHEVTRVDGVILKDGEQEPIAGFSREFPDPSEKDSAARHRTIRYAFSAPNGTYVLIMTLRERVSGETNPIPTETTFHKRVSLTGGEVNISPD